MTLEELSSRNEFRKERCGNCCFYEMPNTDTGWGECHKPKGGMYCRPNDICRRHTSKEEAKHYLHILIEHNKWRRDDNVPNSCTMQDPKEIGKAIDFAVDYIKTFMKI